MEVVETYIKTLKTLFVKLRYCVICGEKVKNIVSQCRQRCCWCCSECHALWIDTETEESTENRDERCGWCNEDVTDFVNLETAINTGIFNSKVNVVHMDVQPLSEAVLASHGLN